MTEALGRPAGEPAPRPRTFEEDGCVYLLYSVAGERGIALARVEISQ